MRESLLLARAMPEVAEAMSASRVAVIASQERIAEVQQPALAVIRELLRGLTNGDIPLKIHVTAAFGSNTLTQNLNQEPSPALTTINFASASISTPAAVSLQFAVAPPLGSGEAPQYTLQTPATHRTSGGSGIGTAGNPAVRNLEVKFQHRWWPTTTA